MDLNLILLATGGERADQYSQPIALSWTVWYTCPPGIRFCAGLGRETAKLIKEDVL